MPGAGAPSRFDETLTVYALLKSPQMTACDVTVAPPTWHTESITSVLPAFCTSCFEQRSGPMLPPTEFISLSVSASVQCWIVCDGRLRFSNAIERSHSPGFGCGRWGAV